MFTRVQCEPDSLFCTHLTSIPFHALDPSIECHYSFFLEDTFRRLSTHHQCLKIHIWGACESADMQICPVFEIYYHFCVCRITNRAHIKIHIVTNLRLLYALQISILCRTLLLKYFFKGTNISNSYPLSVNKSVYFHFTNAAVAKA
jgi:hypothetical protein